MFSGVHRIPACDRRKNILPRHSPRYAYASRGKNHDRYYNVGKCDLLDKIWQYRLEFIRGAIPNFVARQHTDARY